MTDTFMSGWGAAENKTSKYVVVCDTFEQAKEIYKNLKAEKNSEMRYIRLSKNKPQYNPKWYRVDYTTYADAKRWHDKYINVKVPKDAIDKLEITRKK